MKELETAESVAQFLCTPPPWSLPEEIRQTVRETIEHLDIEWALRHPTCVRNEWDAPDASGRWGKACLACFAPVPAFQLIGELEEALSFYQVLTTREGADEPFRPALECCSTALKEFEAALNRMATVGYERFFPDRSTIRAILEPMTQLQTHLTSLAQETEAKRNPEAVANALLPIHQVRLITLLGQILVKSRLSCFTVQSMGTKILSPGMQVLVECLATVQIEVSAAQIETILHAGLPAGGSVPPCPK